MLLALDFLLVFLLGALLVSFFPVVTRKAEQVGLALLLGIGGYTTALFYANWLGMKLTRGTTLLLLILSISLCVALRWKTIRAFRWPKLDLGKIKRPPLAEIWLVLVIVFLVGAITAKNLYWPVFANDAHSYDGRAKFMVQEGDIHIKLLDRGLSGQSNLTYPPDFPLALSLSYFWGATHQSKIVITFYFIALLLVFYSQLVRYVSRLNALIFTFLLTISPELYCHAALGLTNLPAAAYLSIGSLYLFIWQREKQSTHLFLAATLIGFSGGIRVDALFFAFVVLAWVVLFAVLDKENFKSATAAQMPQSAQKSEVRSQKPEGRNQESGVRGGFLASGLWPLISGVRWRHILIYALLSLTLGVCWQFYIKLNLNLPQSGAFLHFDQLTDMTRLREMLRLAWHVTFSAGFHGWTFYIFLIALGINLFTRGKDNLSLLPIIGLYAVSILVLYHLTRFTSLRNMMTYSFKRMLFYFLPLVLYYASTSRVVEELFKKVEAFQGDSMGKEL